MKQHLILALILFVHLLSYSQQEPRSSFFWNNYMHTNPAMTGAHYKHHANAQWRNQWTKVNGAPSTLWANYTLRLDSIHHAIGVSYEYDVIGNQKSHTALATYTYHLPIKNVVLSFGLSAGLNAVNFDENWVFVNGTYVDLSKPYDTNMFQADFGVALRGEKWNCGISATQLSSPLYNSNYYSPAIHYWAFGDYTFDLGEKWTFTPRAQVFTDTKKITSVLALVASFKERLWFGTTLASPALDGIGVGPMIGYDIQGKYRIGYTYEYWSRKSSFGPIQQNGTHEIILSFQLK